MYIYIPRVIADIRDTYTPLTPFKHINVVSEQINQETIITRIINKKGGTGCHSLNVLQLQL